MSKPMHLAGRFGRKSPSRRRAVSEVIAILLLIVIVVATVILVLIFGTGVIRDLTSNGISTPISASGQMFVPGTKGTTADLTLAVKNSESNQIDDIVVSCPTTIFAAACPTMAVSYANVAVSGANPLPLGSTAVSSFVLTSAPGTQFVRGVTYTVTISVTFAAGSLETVAVDLVAQ